MIDELIRQRRDLFVEPHIFFELYRGVRLAPNPKARLHWIDRIGERFRLLPFDRDAARMAARMADALQVQGLSIPHVDVFIAASSLVWGDGVVVTRDAGHFRRLSQFGIDVLPA